MPECLPAARDLSQLSTALQQVIKIGTSSITRPEQGTLNLSTLARICETVKSLTNLGQPFTLTLSHHRPHTLPTDHHPRLHLTRLSVSDPGCCFPAPQATMWSS